LNVSLVVSFHLITNTKREHQNQQNILNGKTKKIKIFNDIILQWVLGFIAKYRNILTNLYLHIHGL